MQLGKYETGKGIKTPLKLISADVVLPCVSYSSIKLIRLALIEPPPPQMSKTMTTTVNGISANTVLT